MWRLRKRLATVLPVDFLVGGYQLFQALLVKVGILGHAVLLLDACENGLEMVMLYAHDHVAEHVDQAPVGVQRETPVARLPAKSCNGPVRQAQVQDGIQHARHADRAAAPDGDQ